MKGKHEVFKELFITLNFLKSPGSDTFGVYLLGCWIPAGLQLAGLCWAAAAGSDSSGAVPMQRANKGSIRDGPAWAQRALL